jgi:protoporphyrinogen oxidase
MTSDSYQTVVVGGGISGLAMAHYAAEQGQSTLLLEASERVGGCLYSHRFESCAGFWAELGAHTCYNSYGRLLGIMETCGLLEQIQEKRKLPYRLLADDKIHSIGSRLFVPELLTVLPKLFAVKKPGKSVGEYYARVLGRRNYERVLGPALDAVICQPAAGFPAEALFRKRERRKDVIRNYTFPGGVEDISRTIAQRLGAALRSAQPVTAIAKESDGFRITSTSGEEYIGQHLVLATPVATAATLLAEPFPKLATLLSRIQQVSVESLAVVVPKNAVDLPPLAGLIGVDESFYSMVSRDPRPDPAWRGFTFHFKPQRLDEEQKLERICRVLGIARSDIAAQASTLNQLPALALGHYGLIEQIDEALTGGRLGLTGNYFAGVSIEDCLVRTLSEFRRLNPEVG